MKLTHGCISLTTILVKHYNDLLDRQNYGRSRNEVICFNIWEVFCVYVVPRCIQKLYPTEKYVTSSLPRPELCLSSKSLYCFTNRVVKLMQPCVYLSADCKNLISIIQLKLLYLLLGIDYLLHLLIMVVFKYSCLRFNQLYFIYQAEPLTSCMCSDYKVTRMKHIL